MAKSLFDKIGESTEVADGLVYVSATYSGKSLVVAEPVGQRTRGRKS